MSTPLAAPFQQACPLNAPPARCRAGRHAGARPGRPGGPAGGLAARAWWLCERAALAGAEAADPGSSHLALPVARQAARPVAAAALYASGQGKSVKMRVSVLAAQHQHSNINVSLGFE
eukprot:154269-Chlamydomonas_euryale.AAC.6